MRLALLDPKLEIVGIDARIIGDPVYAGLNEGWVQAFWAVIGVGVLVGIAVTADSACVAWNTSCSDDDDKDEEEETDVEATAQARFF